MNTATINSLPFQVEKSTGDGITVLVIAVVLTPGDVYHFIDNGETQSFVKEASEDMEGFESVWVETRKVWSESLQIFAQAETGKIEWEFSGSCDPETTITELKKRLFALL